MRRCSIVFFLQKNRNSAKPKVVKKHILNQNRTKLGISKFIMLLTILIENIAI
jgi:hypothetical protein